MLPELKNKLTLFANLINNDIMKHVFSTKSLKSVLYFIGSMVLLGGIWELIARVTKNEVPSPAMTWEVFKEVMQNPFQNDPDYKGIGTKLLSSLSRVGIGFGLGS